MVKRLTRNEIVRRVAREIPDGSFVNLGIGLPTLVADYVSHGIEVLLHSENGILNVEPKPPAGEEDWDLVNAGKRTCDAATGRSLFRFQPQLHDDARRASRLLDFGRLPDLRQQRPCELVDGHKQ